MINYVTANSSEVTYDYLETSFEDFVFNKLCILSSTVSRIIKRCTNVGLKTN